MNAKETKTLDLLFAFVKENYKEILEEEYNDVSYKNIDATFLAKSRRKTTAFLKYIGEREFRGCIYGKNNVSLIKNSDMVKLNKRLKDRIILTPDLILYKTYSKEYIKILRFFVENVLWEKLNEHNIEYLTEYVIPTLISKKDVFEHPGIPKVFVSTRQRSYHYFPDVWTRPDNDNLEEPLVGLELEVYARNSSVFENKSNFFYLQHDGSLSEENGGTEITTIPMSFNDLIREGGGIDILTKDFMPRFSCYSQKATETGFHIHLSKINFNKKFVFC